MSNEPNESDPLDEPPAQGPPPSSFDACPSCGEPVSPLPGAVLMGNYGEPSYEIAQCKNCFATMRRPVGREFPWEATGGS